MQAGGTRNRLGDNCSLVVTTTGITDHLGNAGTGSASRSFVIDHVANVGATVNTYSEVIYTVSAGATTVTVADGSIFMADDRAARRSARSKLMLASLAFALPLRMRMMASVRLVSGMGLPAGVLALAWLSCSIQALCSASAAARGAAASRAAGRAPMHAEKHPKPGIKPNAFCSGSGVASISRALNLYTLKYCVSPSDSASLLCV